MEIRVGVEIVICVTLALTGVVQPLLAREIGHDGLRVEPIAEQTNGYLRTLDVADCTNRGSDFSSSLFDRQRVAEQLGRSVDELVSGRDYDFERLEQIEQRLEGVDRDRVLAAIFEQVTEGASSNKEKHIALAGFLAKAFHHGPLNPTYSESFLHGAARHPSALRVEDPLVLLELGEGWCGRVATVAVDLWRAAGMEARQVELGRHIVSELNYDGGWHYIDADMFTGAEMVKSSDGRVPSLAELSRTPLAIDRPASYLEPANGGRLVGSSVVYPSYHYFGVWPDVDEPKTYRYKTGTRRQQARDLRFGWSAGLTREVHAKDIALSSIPARFQPGAPRFVGVDIGTPKGEDVTVEIRWRRSKDRDGDLIGYRVYVSGESRGWSYDPKGAKLELLPYLSHPAGWQPSMYDRLLELPKSEVALMTTEVEQVRLALEPGHTYYVTVMPFDAHGEAIGREIYRASRELEISL